MSAIYKTGQGYWTRMMSAIALGLIVLMGANWVADMAITMKVGDIQPIYIAAAAAVLFVATFAIIGFILIGRKPRVVDFMIATEGELKKVNWSTRREVIGSTWVVIGLTLFVAIFCFVADQAFLRLFQAMNVLELGS